MINLAEVTRLTELAQSFSIHRSTGRFERGGWAETSSSDISAVGVINPASPRQIQQVPEGDRANEMVVFVSVTPMYVTRKSGSGISDVLTYKGENYRVASVNQAGAYGFWTAIAARLGGQ